MTSKIEYAYEKKDYIEAVRLYRLSEEQENTKAQTNLGMRHMKKEA